VLPACIAHSNRCHQPQALPTPPTACSSSHCWPQSTAASAASAAAAACAFSLGASLPPAAGAASCSAAACPSYYNRPASPSAAPRSATHPAHPDPCTSQLRTCRHGRLLPLLLLSLPVPSHWVPHRCPAAGAASCSGRQLPTLQQTCLDICCSMLCDASCPPGPLHVTAQNLELVAAADCCRCCCCRCLRFLTQRLVAACCWCCKLQQTCSHWKGHFCCSMLSDAP
jgi:hypothetical protein